LTYLLYASTAVPRCVMRKLDFRRILQAVP